MVVDELAGRAGCGLRGSWRFPARFGTGRFGGENVLLIEPQTYMNNSGRIVGLLGYQKVGPDELVVVSDDADLEFGRIRIRASGGSGGHKGLASLIEALGCDSFARVRIGIGRDEAGGSLVEHVLRPFAGESAGEAREIVRRAADAVVAVLEEGVTAGMNRFNAAPGARGGKKESESSL